MRKKNAGVRAGLMHCIKQLMALLQKLIIRIGWNANVLPYLFGQGQPPGHQLMGLVSFAYRL
ncbi:hypothetical protein [Acuticoccus yangtzensis]|nr:hypothetical protein [Acuticoccus yangtzensis]